LIGQGLLPKPVNSLPQMQHIFLSSILFAVYLLMFIRWAGADSEHYFLNPRPPRPMKMSGRIINVIIINNVIISFFYFFN
jgi:hypothetical protein